MKIAARIDPERQRYYTQQGWWGTRTLLDHWNETVQRYGDRRYVCGDNGVWLTYRQVDDYGGRLAAYLWENGLECGDVAAIQLPNWTAYCVAYVAGLKAGAVLHLISRNTEKSELADLLTRSGAKALICPTSFRGLDYEAMLSNFRKDIPSLRCVVLADELEPARGAPPRHRLPPRADRAHADRRGGGPPAAVPAGAGGPAHPPGAVHLLHGGHPLCL